MGGGLSDATIRALRGEWELSGSTEPFEIWLAEKSDGAMGVTDHGEKIRVGSRACSALDISNDVARVPA